MAGSSVVLLALAAFASAATPPTWPSQFEARITLVEDGRAAEGVWFWSGVTHQDRMDFENQEGKFTEIHDYATGLGYVVWTPAQGTATCKTEKIGSQPTFDFSGFTFQGQREHYHHWVNVWTQKNTLGLAEYLDDANTTEPVQLSQKDLNGTYEGIFFNGYRGGPVPPSYFNVSTIFTGQCTPSVAPRTYVRLPVLPTPKDRSIYANLTAHGNAAVTADWANNNWNCGDIACTYRVAAGAAQPTYACAEFVARSLCAGGYIQGISPTSPQSAYAGYVTGGRKWDLCWVSSKGGGPMGLGDLLDAAGWAQSKGCQAAYAIIVLGYDHFIVGVGAGIVDAHNNARYHNAIGNYGAITVSYSN